MPPAPPRILYVTDLTYEARGRRYCDEDIYLSSRLREDFTIALCHPLDAAAFMDRFDAVVVRNSGPVQYYQAQYDAFRAQAENSGARVYTELTGKADMVGKQYLVDLSAEGYPVIPTIDRREDLSRLPAAEEYVTKPKHGADSHGLKFLTRDRLEHVAFDNLLLQPRIHFQYEVSFYFIDRTFQYALYAPRPDQRWNLQQYLPSVADLEFAQLFVDWNTIDHGIQRVDACRTPEGELLLVELEDLNPYLSLDLLEPPIRDDFVSTMKTSLHRFLSDVPA